MRRDQEVPALFALGVGAAVVYLLMMMAIHG